MDQIVSPATKIDDGGQAEQVAGVVRRTKELGPGIGKRLRQARQAAGLTTRELAQRAHTSRQTIQDISDGKGGNAGVGTLADLARAMGVSPGWLAYGEGRGPVEQGQDEGDGKEE